MPYELPRLGAELASRGDAGILFPVSSSPSDSSTSRPAPEERRIDVMLAIAIGAMSFALHLAIASQLDALRSFDQQDVFFHADTQSRLECAVLGDCASRSTIAHPNLALFVNPAIALVAALMPSSGAPSDGAYGADLELAQRSRSRHLVSVWLSPFAAGIQAGIAFLLFLLLGLRRIPALVASLFGVVAFSSLVFGSLPESFALSGVAITLAFLLAAQRRRGDSVRWVAWYGLGVVATGITATNLVYIAILFVTGRRNAGDDWRRAGLRFMSLLPAICLTSLLLTYASQGLYGGRPLEVAEGARYVETWTRDNDPLARAAEFPTALANSIAATYPVTVQNYQAKLHDSKYQFRFTFEGRPRVFTAERPFATMLVLLSIVGAITMMRSEPLVRNAAAAALAIFSFNFVLHSFWGVEHFLYSQHWIQALTLLIAGVLFLPRRFEAPGLALMGILTVAIAVNNYKVGRVMLEYFVAAGAS